MAGTLFPVSQQWFDNNGHPLSGGQVFTYVAQSSTPKTAFTDNTLLHPHDFPVLLDAAGRTVMFGSGMYKVVVKDSNGVILDVQDNVYLIDREAERLETTRQIEREFSNIRQELTDRELRILREALEQALLAIEQGRNVLFGPFNAGSVPASGTDPNRFIRSDGQWVNLAELINEYIGENGLIGPPGPPGPPGPKGADGKDGVDGADGDGSGGSGVDLGALAGLLLPLLAASLLPDLLADLARSLFGDGADVEMLRGPRGLEGMPGERGPRGYPGLDGAPGVSSGGGSSGAVARVAEQPPPSNPPPCRCPTPAEAAAAHRRSLRYTELSKKYNRGACCPLSLEQMEARETDEKKRATTAVDEFEKKKDPSYRTTDEQAAMSPADRAAYFQARQQKTRDAEAAAKRRRIMEAEMSSKRKPARKPTQLTPRRF